MEVIVMKVVRKKGSSLVAGVIASGIGPFAGDGLDEALGLAIGLWAVRSGETVFDAEFLAGGGEEFGAIGGASISEEASDLDAMVFVEGHGLAQSLQGAGDLLVGMEAGKGEAGVVIDGDVQTLDAGAGVAMGAVAGGAHAGLLEAARVS